MSTEIGDQIIVDISSRPYSGSSQPLPTTPPKTDKTSSITTPQPEAGPSTRRRTRTSDVHLDEPGDSVPKVEVKEETKEKEERKYIQPDHFYQTTNHPNQAGVTRGIPKIGDGSLSPHDDPHALRGIPVFKPTMEEFQDFEAYATATTEWGQYSGIVKIVPPEEWTAAVPPISKATLSTQTIRVPIQQNIFGSSGLFRIANVPKNKNRPLSVKEWFNKCKDKKFAGPGPKDMGKTLNRDSKEAIEWRARRNAEIKKEKEEKREKKKKAAERKAERQAAASAKEEGQVNDDGESNEKEQTEDVDTGDPTSNVPPLDHSSTSTHSSPEPTNPTTPEADDESKAIDPWYKTFKPSEDWLPPDTRPEDYTVEACAALERQLWKNLGLGEPSWYGADMEGSLFVDEKTPWNVAHLPNLLNRWDLKHLPGVNAPYLYFGMWGASFAWHVEDMDLFSINYIHFGAPKYWYAVPQLQAEKFERVLTGYFPEESRNCDQYLRHKSFAVSPQRLADDGVHVNMLLHNQGEFVITYPRGYHAGFNMGFNCAESVNFALESWVELGRRAKSCQCVTHSVHIDVDEMIAKEEKRLNGQQELLDAIAEERQNKKPRKRVIDPSGPPRKRVKREIAIAGDEADETIDMDQEEVHNAAKVAVMRKKKPKSFIDLSPSKSKLETAIVIGNPVYPCLFCPSLELEGLLPVFEPTDTIKNIWKPRTKSIQIHHQCALAMPGIGIEDRELDGKLLTYVVGLENIEQARWKLKCGACQDNRVAKSGAKIQCTKGKCPRAYHVSCAKNHDATSLKIWEVEIPVLPAEGEEPLPEGAPIPMIKDIKVELLCALHNPENKAQLEERKANNYKQKVMSVPIGSSIKIKVRGGASLEYTLLEIREQTQEVVIQDNAGESAVYPWFNIDFRPASTMTENEYARIHTHVRRISENRSTGTTPVADRSTYPQKQPPSAIPRPVLPSVRNGDLNVPRPHLLPISQPHSAPLRLDQMLNPKSEVPSRVFLCEDPRTAGYIPKNYPPPLQYMRTSVPSPFVNGRSVPHPVPPIVQRHYYPPQMTYAPPGLHAQIAPYDSRDPYSRPLPPYERSHHLPNHHMPMDTSRRSSLTDQPPPLIMANGHHVLPPVHQMHPPPHAAHIRSYAAPHRINGSHPYPPPSNGYTPSQQGSHNHTLLPTNSNTSSTNGVGKIDLGIQRMQALMNTLRPLVVPAIHLAGTNGKGSVSAILESCLMAAGLNVARYNSPHLLEPRDAIRINGRPPSRQAYMDAITLVENLNRQYNLQATTFEVATAAAYQIINNILPSIDIMIIECGMGGARDATNVIPDDIKVISGLTAVGLDHTSFLGSTIVEIAEEKSKIVQNGGTLVLAPQAHQDAILAARHVVIYKNARIIESSRSEELPRPTPPMSLRPFQRPAPKLVRTLLPDLSGSPSKQRSGRVIVTELSLGGQHQLDNLSLAISILHVLRSDARARSIQPKLGGLTDQVVQTGVGRAEWAGRCSWIEYRNLPILVDGAHNSDSAKTLRQYIDSLNFGDKPRPRVKFIVSLSNSPGKSIESVLTPLLRKGDEIITMEFSTPIEGMPWIKSTPSDEIARVASTIVGQGNVKFGGQGINGLRDLLDQLHQQAEEDLIVVCGSLYGVADVYRLFTGV
ncbi:uncharacterized protein IL334_002413 [Kwoniella shivajii]|uniref:[histone H3]-trimethyl-L-lysine(9) demethylase n=1 Tax=Kwoniella shivajii TaxID=564305 RepID=A0ABZ1CUN9_9TREE|nr:hypothetical protein IL334_002413 [Kwoniella shivajii]